MADVALVVGGTGLVGKYLVEALVSRYALVICIVRTVPQADVASPLNKPSDVTENDDTAQLKPVGGTLVYKTLADFSALPECIENLATAYDLNESDAFSTLGTTLKDAGSKPNFHRIDYGLNYAFAVACQQAGCARFFLLSSMGASAHNKTSFYLRTKGELEEAVATLRFKSVYVFQPSLLLGQHEGRFAENVGQKLFGMVKGIVPKHSAFRPIEAERVAHAMALTAHVIERKPEMVQVKVQPNGLNRVSNAAMLKLFS